MAPFYPLKAKEKQVDIIWVGFVIGIMAMMQIVSSALVGRFLHKIGGRNPIIMIGSILIIIQTTTLCLINFEEDTNRFLLFSFIAQILGGFGAGANSTASMAILSSFSNQEREKYIGYVEAANGVGLLFGPLLGAMLYSFGGYMMPFATFGGIYIVAYPWIMLTLSRAKQILRTKSQPEEDHPKVEVDVKMLISKPRFLYGLMSQMMITMSIQYLAPTLSVHLHNYGYSAVQIGFAYGIPAILYATTCPFMYILTSKMQKRGVIVIGFVLITIAMLMIGQSN